MPEPTVSPRPRERAKMLILRAIETMPEDVGGADFDDLIGRLAEQVCVLEAPESLAALKDGELVTKRAAVEIAAMAVHLADRALAVRPEPGRMHFGFDPSLWDGEVDGDG